MELPLTALHCTALHCNSSLDSECHRVCTCIWHPLERPWGLSNYHIGHLAAAEAAQLSWCAGLHRNIYTSMYMNIHKIIQHINPQNTAHKRKTNCCPLIVGEHALHLCFTSRGSSARLQCADVC